MPRKGKCGGKCSPVCYHHLGEEKGRAAEQDFSTAALERCWLILKPSWTTFFFLLYKIFSSFGHFSWVLKAQWIFESLETNDVKFDLWCTFIFFLDYADSIPDSKQNFASYIFVFMHLSLSFSLSLCPWSILADAIIYWTRLFCYWNLLRFLFRK